MIVYLILWQGIQINRIMVIKIILTTKALFNLFNQKVKKYIPIFFLSAQIINGKKMEKLC